MCIIPARGGSKRIPGKNTMMIGGKPLVCHSILHALNTPEISRTVVSTDDPQICLLAQDMGAMVVNRPAELCSDTATSESALVHVLDQLKASGMPDPDLVVFLQATSPIREDHDISRALAQLLKENSDSLFSATRNHRFVWGVSDGGIRSINYDFRARKREQDFEVQFQENGSIYVFKPEILRNNNNRLGGRISVYEMDFWSSFQIDTPEDVDLISWLLSRSAKNTQQQWPAKLDLLVFDFDGVFTDNLVMVDENGRESVLCSRGDGLGVSMLKKLQIPVLVISTETNPVVSARCKKLGLPVLQAVADKGLALREYAAKAGISLQKTMYVGNDVNDLPAMRIVGWPVATGDAVTEVVQNARLRLEARGGKGAVRELCDKLCKFVSQIDERG